MIKYFPDYLNNKLRLSTCLEVTIDKINACSVTIKIIDINGVIIQTLLPSGHLKKNCGVGSLSKKDHL